MPEGDTIYRAARTLDKALRGQTVTSFRSELSEISRLEGTDQSILGRKIDQVRSVGKHLLIELDGNLTIRSHMRMSGSWHIYRPGERWRYRGSAARIIVETATWVAVGFSIVEAELVDTDQLDVRSRVSRLGPDLLGENFDMAEAVTRISQRADSEIAVALLNQSLISGIGNIYKSETLFLARIHPFATVESLPSGSIERAVSIARDLLRQNVQPGAHRHGIRTTVPGLDPSARLYVYRRARKPCRRCDTPILRKLQGIDARSTYWCPSCQQST